MLKNIQEVSFKEFYNWAEERARDGQWSFGMAMTCLDIIKDILKIKSLFHRTQKREARWKELRDIYFDSDATLDV